MNRYFMAALVIAGGTACRDDGALAPQPDKVYIAPRFIEAINPDHCCPQIGDNGGSPQDWELAGTTSDLHGSWAVPGSTVVLRVHSPLYEPLELSLVVPDTVTPNEHSQHRYFPVVSITRVVPTMLRAQWSADFTGPTVRLEIYAPHGLSGVRITMVRVYWQSCRSDDVYCDDRITGDSFGSAWQPDPSTTGLQGWAQLDGPWSDWPSVLPPAGYDQSWRATLSFTFEDDQGHEGHGACGPAAIPGYSLKPDCTVLLYH